MEDVTRKVARQYTDHAYPAPVVDLEADRAAGGGDFSDPSLFGPALWPEGRPAPDLDILVAGCGTQQAAMLAFANPESRVVGIDLSDASLAHQRFLREKHGLTNLQLMQGDLREVGGIGRQFDLVVSTGVLHHMADPGEGLRALAGVLRPHGAMGLMVYGQTGRSGVYLLQDAFRRLGLGQTAEDVAVVRAALAGLNPLHPVHAYLKRTPELEHDVAIVDTFLHPQDRAYTVPELLEWVADAGLEFQGWAQNQLYYPDAFIPEPLRSRIRQLPHEAQWAVVEEVLGFAGIHIFTARHRGRALRPDFDGEAWLGHRPRLAPGVVLGEVRPDGGAVLWLRGQEIPLQPVEALTVGLIDGERTVAGILDHPSLRDMARPEREAFARRVFDALWKMGTLLVEIGPPDPVARAV